VCISGSELERADHLRAFSGIVPESSIFSGKMTLPELASVLANANLFIGGSTGPLHIAAAVGTPVIGLYGPIYSTTADRWGPCGPGHRVFKPDVPVCRCKVGKCTLGNCLERISVPAVLAAGEDILHQPAAHDLPQAADLRTSGQIQK
jgi:ADP-heptose:LPS heptosyltransferase